MAQPPEFLILLKNKAFWSEFHWFSLGWMNRNSKPVAGLNISGKRFNKWIPVGVILEIGQNGPDFIYRGIDFGFGVNVFHSANIPK